MKEGRTKNRGAWICLVSICLIGVIYFMATEHPSSEPEQITIDCDFQSFTFDELNEEADIIVRVKVADELTEENSFEIVSRESGDTAGIFAERKCIAVEYYKDETGRNAEELTVIEPAGVIDGVINRMGSYMSLDKDTDYVLYLRVDPDTGNKYIISGNNGVVRLDGSDWVNWEFPEIAEETVKDYLEAV